MGSAQAGTGRGWPALWILRVAGIPYGKAFWGPSQLPIRVLLAHLGKQPCGSGLAHSWMRSWLWPHSTPLLSPSLPQGWISDTQNLASPGPTADASTTDHMLVTHLSQVDLHVPELSRTRCSKNPGDNGALCPRSPLLPSTGTVHLGGLQFTQADGHYWCCDEGLRSQQALPDQTTP